MQCKDIPDAPILLGLQSDTRWHTWAEDGYSMPTVRDYMPKGIPDKLALAKMRGLHKRGLVGGCPCGCRGDFVLTLKGNEWIHANGLQFKND